MTDDTHHRGSRDRALGSSVVLASGLIGTGMVWAAPAHATCSPQARPCIDKVFMDGPTTLAFTWTGYWGGGGYSAQVRYHSTSDPGLFGPAGGPIPENQFESVSNRWDIMNVVPGSTYVLKVQGCKDPIDFIPSGVECTEWDEKSFTVPLSDDPPRRSLPKDPVGDGTPPYLDRQIDLADVTGSLPSAPTATVVADVDVYNAKNEPDGSGRVLGMLRQGASVTLTGTCAPESWCQVSGDAVPGGQGWVWGHLNPS